jgi:hypothetical protein
VRETNDGRRSEHLSVRISPGLKSEIRKEAEREDTCVSSIVDRALTRFLFFDVTADYVEALTINREVIEAVFGFLPPDAIECIGKSVGSRLMLRFFSHMNLDYDLDTIISRLFGPADRYSRWYKFSTVTLGPPKKLVFVHTLGLKWSIFLGSYLGAMIESITKIQPRVEIDYNIVTIIASTRTLDKDRF